MSTQVRQENHLKSSDFLTDVVIGMSDGLTVPFALAAGLSGAIDSNSIIIVTGVTAVAAGSGAMAFGGYLAGKKEIEISPGIEKKDVKTFFANIGLSEEIQEKATEEIAKDKKQWVDFMMKHELRLDKPDPKRAAKSALNIGLSYVAGGLVPLSPYFFTDTPFEGLKISAVLTLLCLFIFGFFKTKIKGLNPWLGAIRVTLTGALAASAAFGVAKLFEL